MASARTPRRLRITLDVNLLTDAARRLQGSKVSAAADAAIDAAMAALGEHLVDEEITLYVDARSEWAYVWSDRSVGQVMEISQDPDESDDAGDPT